MALNDYNVQVFTTSCCYYKFNNLKFEVGHTNYLRNVIILSHLELVPLVELIIGSMLLLV